MPARKDGRGPKTITGTIKLSFKGTGYVRQEKGDDIEVPYDSLNTALHADTVKVLLSGRGRGKVLEVLKRGKRGFAGELIRKEGDFLLKPSDAKMYTKIIIPKNDLNGAKVGDKVFVTISKWTMPKEMPLGKVERVLGLPGAHEAEMQGIILERGFDSTFPSELEDEAKRLKHAGIPESEIKKRRDFRKVTTFTIDPADAKDFDDALSFRKLPDGNNVEVGIHIADVSHYVVPKTPLDKEAFERATSVYLVDRTIPMLPEALSNDLCSLNPREDKLTMSAVFELDLNGNVLKEWFGKTIINSDKRFTYEEAQKVLDAKAGPFYDELNTLNLIAKKLTAARVQAGALLIDTEEIKFKLDATGKPLSVYIKERGDTNKLIEEFMLLANKRVAMFGSKDKTKKDRLFIYRIHDEPDKDKLANLKEYLKLLGYTLNERRGSVAPQEFNRLFKELSGKNEKGTIETAVVRSMQKAVYSTKNIGHFGLAFPFYTHFTSPIRRYPDIIAHRMLQTYLEGVKLPAELAHKYQSMAEHSTEREIEAAEAERASVKYKQVEYMSERVGEEFAGVISGMTEWGLYVAEKTTRAEGAIRLRDIKEDYFTYDEKNFVLRGKNSGRMLRIGDELKIRVKSVDLERQLIDYELVENNNGRNGK